VLHPQRVDDAIGAIDEVHAILCQGPLLHPNARIAERSVCALREPYGRTQRPLACGFGRGERKQNTKEKPHR
jgi:hypothetical protein